jgi:hypothetical protein
VFVRPNLKLSESFFSAKPYSPISNAVTPWRNAAAPAEGRSKSGALGPELGGDEALLLGLVELGTLGDVLHPAMSKKSEFKNANRQYLQIQWRFINCTCLAGSLSGNKLLCESLRWML